MKRHGSMNHIYRLVWSAVANGWIAVAETTRGRGKGGRRKLVAAALSLTAIAAQAAPTGGQIVAGTGSIRQSGTTTTISQTSQNASLNWSGFNIAPQETVNFVQPSASAIAVNRIFDTSGTQILGRLNANGQVFLINPNGILFGAGAQVNVGGLVASTLDFHDASLNSNSRVFSGGGSGSVVNQGSITAANGGYVALLGNHVSNQGSINAQQGAVALGAGNAVTLTFSGNSLLQLQVDQSVLNSLAENGGLIRADGGRVIMTAGAKDALLASVVNNTGVIEARTVENQGGTITLLGGMAAGTVNVGGTLDASAPNGGNGGFIETSAANVKVANDARITTAAALGLAGTWLIDPTDFTIAPIGGDQTGATLSAALGLSNVTISSAGGASGSSGNVNVDDTVSWSGHKLTLNASNDVNVNATMTASGSASLDLEPGSGHVNVALGSAGFNGRVNFSGSGVLTMNNHVYTVISSLGTATSSGDGTLQGTLGNLAGYYALGSDINAAGTSAWNSGAGFTPIGTGSTLFTGTFDGLGHTISGLAITPSASGSGRGLFGESSGVIRNVGLVGGSVAVTASSYTGQLAGFNSGAISNSYSTGSVSASASSNDVGGLVGWNLGGTISRSYATGTVNAADSISVGGLLGGIQGGTVSNSYATGNVTGNSNSVGGLIGWSYGATGATNAITNSYATGSVSGASYVGGLVGSNYGLSTISQSYAKGSVSGNNAVGGLVGHNYGAGTSSSGASAINNSYATGSVTGAAGSTFIGGLVGNNDSTFTVGAVTNSFSTGLVSAGTGSSLIGGLVGDNSNGTVTGSFWDKTSSGQATSAAGTGMTTANMQNQANFTSSTAANGNLNPAWDFAGTWSMSGGSYPLLISGMTALTVTANNATSIFNGAAYASNNGVTYTGLNGYRYSGTPSGLLGSISYSGSSQTAVDVGTYSIIASGVSSTGQQGYNITFVNGALTINPLALIGSISSGSSTYGSTLTPGTVSFSNMVAGHVVTAAPVTVNTTGLTSTSGNLIAGTHAGIESVSGVLSGADAVKGNYTFAGATGNYTVTPLALTGSIGTGSSTYGSALTPGAVGFTNAVAGDALGTATVAINTTGLTSSSGHLIAGTHSGIESISALSGSDAGNYTHAGLTGNYTVNPLALNATVASGSSTYGSALTPGAASFTNAVAGDLVTPAAVTVNTTGLTSSSGHPIAGTHSGIEAVGTALGGADAGNYTFAGASGNYTVTPLALTGSIGAGSSTYGAGLAAGAASFTNAVAGDVLDTATVVINTSGLTSSSGHLIAGSHTGIEAVTALSGIDGGNYTFAGVTGNYTVSPLTLTGSIGTGGSTYGSVLTPGAASFTNAVAGDALGTATVTINTSGLTSSSGHLIAGSHAGIEGVSALSGTDAGNYTFTGVTGDYSVSQLALTGSIGTGSSTYGSVLAPGAASFTNAVAGDALGTATVTVNTSGLTSSSGHLIAGTHAGIEAVSALSGADAGNYTSAGVAGDYSVNKLVLSGSIGAGSSTYGSALTPGAASLSGAITGDALGTATVTVNTAGLTSSSGHLIAGTHTGIEGVSALSGSDGGNYSFAGVAGDYSVSQLALNATLAAGSSTYGSALAPGVASFTNAVAGDLVTPAAATVNTTGLTSSSGHLIAGTHSGIEAVGTALGGADAGNYTFAGASGNYTVTPLALTGSIGSGSSTYGAGLVAGAASFTNAVAGDVLDTATVVINTSGLTSSSGHLVAGSHTGIEAVTALSGIDGGNYTFAGVTGNYTVSPLALTGSIGTGGSTYGSVLTPGAASFTNAVAGDALGTATVTVNTSGLTSSSGHLIAGTHTGIEGVSALSGTDAGNYTFTGVTGDYSVNQLALNATLAAGSSIYGSALTPGAASFTNAVAGDLVTPAAVTVNASGLTSASGHLKAGTHNGIEALGTALGGADAGNYTFAGASGDYTVTPLALTGSIGAGSSVYGSALVPGAASFTNVVSGDVLGTATVTVNTAGLTSSSGHLIAGAHTGIEAVSALSGASAGNYTFTGVTGDYSVSPLALNATLAAGGSTYGSILTPGAVNFTNLVAGDLVTPAAITVNTTGLTSSSGHLIAGTHSGIEAVGTALGGTDAGNYTFAGASGNYTVNPLTLAGSIAAGSSIYGSALTPGAVSISNVIAGDSVSAPGTSVNTTGLTSSSGHLTAGTHIGIESASGALGGADAGNYLLGSIAGDYTVNKLSVTVVATGVNKVYDASTSGSVILTGSGLMSGDQVAFNDASASFGNKNAGTGKTVSVSGINASGADAGNYQVSNSGTTTTADITPLAITAVATGASKTYDGNTLAGVTLSGGLAGDAVTFSDTSANFADKNAGAGKTVSVAGVTASGADAGNYMVSSTTTTTANITPATLTYNAAPASIVAGQTPSGLTGTLSGLVTGDTLSNATTGSLTWTSNATPTSQPGLYAIDGGGLSAMNYVFQQAAGNATALTLKAGTAPVSVQNVIAALDNIFAPSHAGINLAALDLVQFNTQAPSNPPSGSDNGMNGVEVKIMSTGVKLPDNIVSTDE
ncbi:YDG domain-containing protein [Collimonas sp.]|jgi:filamentous hemagglutinin family protein|uniref:two-partner secretion domain-containing protein n=1 Tax=Collimonas sp. TaxID=1963772 RepID=UPI002B6E9C43|nr:YDG domain-containing protein [Collimonas sp.]HWW04671.1 YDG domain-containing protein [Collimonas sp.]